MVHWHTLWKTSIVHDPDVGQVNALTATRPLLFGGQEILFKHCSSKTFAPTLRKRELDIMWHVCTCVYEHKYVKGYSQNLPKPEVLLF